ncbi:hypothetical protein LOTGIDRAFT_119250 [Lottia gigantea]|uniref:DhaK domain-containing protein n=1 Tax=Lottia gigantea TaxID=225164 RepID=V4AEF7_LOTGI|nr:hypothetical protein LOTGIDRAFT_119250 [Lottia gigantea]ESO93520.1 hypothetical protein LOTGIDRAFT_119250 [Lottia gigantea]
MAEKRKSKKLINDPENCVDENLEGFTLVNTGIKKVKGHRILVREDYEDLGKQGKVCVLSGGGSGHEPNEAGFVGRGMLTCCVMGSIFAAPPSQELLLAIRLVTRHNPAGCLILIANYTGDRLNFGVAVEKAKQEGIRVACVTVGEDCAMVPSSKSAGRRGLTGFVLAYKLAGALSEEGKSLDEIVDTLNRIIKNMGSLGVCLTPCTVPGTGATFYIGEDEMELGLGVHGEPGVKSLKMTTAKETIQIMVDHMTSLENKNRLSLNKGICIAGP